MSGGVDSAVAAALAVDAGHEVVGVHMALSRNPGTLRTGSRGCCTVEDAFDARRTRGDALDGVALSLERAHERGCDLVVVLDDQHVSHGHRA